MEHITPAPVPHNAKAVIALTSWKKRISTVGLTIFNLLTMCGHDYHIVLTLAEEEFPRKERELPRDLVTMSKAGLFEILWVERNYKSLKKILFAMAKYRTVPIISADDDCLYKRNYADELYNTWRINKNKRICYWCSHMGDRIYNTSGYATLHPPYYYKDAYCLLNDNILSLYEDDLFYAAICYLTHKKGCICLEESYSDIVVSHDETQPLHEVYSKCTDSSTVRFKKMVNACKEAINEHNWK